MHKMRMGGGGQEKKPPEREPRCPGHASLAAPRGLTARRASTQPHRRQVPWEAAAQGARAGHEAPVRATPVRERIPWGALEVPGALPAGGRTFTPWEARACRAAPYRPRPALRSGLIRPGNTGLSRDTEREGTCG